MIGSVVDVVEDVEVDELVVLDVELEVDDEVEELVDVVRTNVVGMTRPQAEQAIEARGLVAEAVQETQPCQFQTGQVCRQNPSPGTRVPPGSPVIIFVQPDLID